ncbi:MAG: immunity 22 family protein [Zavarzinella sp.]
MRETETSHFWVGHFPAALASTYFAEVYEVDRDETPLSAFARDQGERFYDHDFLEYGFSDTAGSAEELVAGYSYSDQWGAEFARRVAAAGLSEVNWFAFISEDEIDRPRSVQGDGYWYHYLGTINYPI